MEVIFRKVLEHLKEVFNKCPNGIFQGWNSPHFFLFIFPLCIQTDVLNNILHKKLGIDGHLPVLTYSGYTLQSKNFSPRQGCQVKYGTPRMPYGIYLT